MPFSVLNVTAQFNRLVGALYLMEEGSYPSPFSEVLRIVTAWPSVPCHILYYGVFTAHTNNEMVTGPHWLAPTNRVKALGLFHEVSC